MLLLQVFSLFILLVQCTVAQTNPNYTLCHTSTEQDLFHISWVNTHFDSNQFSYTFNILGLATRENITNLNTQHSYYAAAKTEISAGTSDKHTTIALNKFCEDVYQQKCPVILDNYTLIQKTVQLPKINLPLVDVLAQYSAWTGDQIPITCLSLAPIGYQDPIWTRIFRYFPIGVAVLAIVTSFIAIYATTPIDCNEITVNYFASALQLALPGMFEVIYYAQFVATMGQLNLSYPKFYPLFASDFAWSFLMLPSHWIANNNHIAKVEQLPADGMSNFTSNIDLNVNYMFMTVLVYFLLLVALCLIGLAMLWLIAKLQKITSTATADVNYTDIVNTHILKVPSPTWNSVAAILFQCITLCYLPLTITSLYQLMLTSYWYILMVAAIVVVFISFLLYGWVTFVVLKLGDTASVLIQSATFSRIGSLYCLFSDGNAKFFFSTIVYKIITSLMVGIFQKSGTAQLIVIILVEAAYFALTLIKWPYVTKQMNIFFVVIAFWRLISVLLNITHVSSLSISYYSKQFVAYTQVCFHMLVFVLFLLVELKNLMAILLGTSDKQFDDSDTLPVRMMTWPRYKKSTDRERFRQYFNQQEEELNENRQLIDAPPARNKPLKTSTRQYRRHLSAVPPMSMAKSNTTTTTRPPSLPPHIEMPYKRLTETNHNEPTSTAREPSTVPLLLSVPPIAATNGMTTIDLNQVDSEATRNKRYSDSNPHSKHNGSDPANGEQSVSSTNSWSGTNSRQTAQMNTNIYTKYPIV